MKSSLKGLMYLWGTVAFLFSCVTFWGKWANLGSAFAIFGSPVAIFVAPAYFGFDRGNWSPALYLYGSLVLILVIGAVTTKLDRAAN
jgi:hypothetical protein